ncbi:hypothetical protein [Thalassotalea sp. ND16A]|uniref:hypothetical protein n=1 Tax=Thalassotalea sp. ND16A TaxID=1535422 RepID=UPI00051E000C|nr:hypothetical protein [Thalassotalea sp. ND16A]KGJ89262.1 hypothetical protein ND16A_2155 [Thalassotalea sp. ND16A]
MNPVTNNIILSVCLVIGLLGCSKEVEQSKTNKAADEPVVKQEVTGEQTKAVVLLRGLPTLNTVSSVAIVELDPESENFGAIISEFETPDINSNAPLHHLYYSPTGRLYATSLDPLCSLTEIGLIRDATGAPMITGVDCLDTGGQQVGEDIMWHSVNGTQYMFVTFMGGTGVDQADGGSIGVFDPQSNALIKIIQARKSQVAEGEPFIMYPHGISAFGDRMVVASTIHPDLATGVGNNIAIIDLNTFTPIQNIVVEDAKPVGFPSSPVEVLFVRPDIVKGAEPAVLVNTMFGFETWKVPYDETTKTFGSPVKLYDGVEQGTGVPLEFYGNESELFISHALPGVIKRYHLANLPELVTSGPDIAADPGAHHMIFYPTQSGRQVIAVQNNLLNLGNGADNDPTDIDFIAKVNAHTISVHDLATSERLATIDFKARYQKGIDNIEGLFGSGFIHHH